MKLRIIALVVVLGLLIAGVVVIVTQDDGEDTVDAPNLTEGERANLSPEERARALLDSLPDGTHQGRLLTTDPATVTFRLVEVLRGSAAVSAAREDGQLAEGESLPGEIYVRDTFQTVTLPIADDPQVRIEVCTEACEIVDTTHDAVITGEAVPDGTPNAVFDFRIAGGSVVFLEQIPLP